MVFMSALIAAVIGFFLGGVINWLADYLPDYELPRRPRYPDGTPRPVAAWLGTTAFLTNRRCTNAAERVCLSWRYPITEFATAMAFFVTVLRIAAINNNTPQFINTTQMLFHLFYIGVFVLIFVIDVEHHLILFNVILPSCAVALLDAALTPADGVAVQWWHASLEPTLIEALIGAALGFGVFFLFYLGGFAYLRVSEAIRGWAPQEVPFGYGDVMLITLCGLILGWRPLIFAMFLTVFLGSLGALLVIIYTKVRGGSGGFQIALPYGPYIIAGVVAVMLFNTWIQWLLFEIVY